MQMSKSSTNECIEIARIIDSHLDRNIDDIATHVMLTG
jgi:hypothetical protein